jgi:hypothetical protein
MNAPSLFSLEPEVLRFRVSEGLQRSWTKPAPNIANERIPKEQVDTTSRAVLDILLTRPFRNGKFPENDDYTRQLRCVRYWVRRSRPIRINVGYAPMKNLNAARESRADWAEFFALCHLCAWHNKVQAVYPPGLHIKIVFDDAAVAMANRPDRAHMDSYIDSASQLIARLGYNSFIRGTGRHSSFAWLFHLFPFAVSRLHLFLWERNPAHRAGIERMDSYARRNLVLPSSLSSDEENRLCRKASHRYRVYWGALLIALWIQRVIFFAHSLVAMYLDGSQHHIRLQGALHLTSLRKGQITQPWQGEGALCDNGHGELVPFVLTRERSAVKKRVVTGLDLLPLEGFDHIKVCWVDQPEPAPTRAALQERSSRATARHDTVENRQLS